MGSGSLSPAPTPASRPLWHYLPKTSLRLEIANIEYLRLVCNRRGQTSQIPIPGTFPPGLCCVSCNEQLFVDAPDARNSIMLLLEALRLRLQAEGDAVDVQLEVKLKE